MTIMKKEQLVSRSTQVRRKRQQPGQPVAAAPSPAKTAAKTPVKAVPASRKTPPAAMQPRRKVKYMVGSNGVETRLPALPIMHFSWQWVSGILAILLILFTIVITNSPMFRVNTIEVAGLTRYTPEDFQNILTDQQSPIFLVDTHSILNRLDLAFPELKQLSVSISMPNHVVVEAVERQPIILWQMKDQAWWIDADGVLLTPRGEAPNLLVIESSAPAPLAVEKVKTRSFIDYANLVFEKKTQPVDPSTLVDHVAPDMLKAALSMQTILPAGASLVYDPISGMGWRDPGGWQVFFGNDLSNIDFKLVQYQTILATLQGDGITPVMISVEHVDSPFFRTE